MIRNKKIKMIKQHYSNESYDRILARIEAAGKPGILYAVAFSFCSAIAIVLVFQLINNAFGIGNTLVSSLLG